MSRLFLKKNDLRKIPAHLAAISLLAMAQPVLATELSDLAESMSPGSFAKLETSGFRGGALLAPSGAANYITMFADSAEWDPINRTVNFIGASHSSPRATFIQYSDDTNSWTTLSHPVHDEIHGYDHNAINTRTGDFFHRPFNGPEIFQYSPSRNSWTEFNLPSSGYQITGALEYFPEMDRLVYVDSALGVWARDLQAGRWERLSNALPMGNYHTFMEYNPVHGVMLFGGGQGDKTVYKMDAAGNIERQGNAPVGLGVGTNESRISVDPISGDYIVLRSNQRMYSYDVINDDWTELSVQYPSGNPTDGTIEASITDYGVIMYIHYDYDKSAIYLYKHSPGTPQSNDPPLRPDPPEDLLAN